MNYHGYSTAAAVPKVWNRLKEKSFVQWEDRWCTRVAEKLSEIGFIWLPVAVHMTEVLFNFGFNP